MEKITADILLRAGIKHDGASFVGAPNVGRGDLAFASLLPKVSGKVLIVGNSLNSSLVNMFQGDVTPSDDPYDVIIAVAPTDTDFVQRLAPSGEILIHSYEGGPLADRAVRLAATIAGKEPPAKQVVPLDEIKNALSGFDLKQSSLIAPWGKYFLRARRSDDNIADDEKTGGGEKPPSKGPIRGDGNYPRDEVAARIMPAVVSECALPLAGAPVCASKGALLDVVNRFGLVHGAPQDIVQQAKEKTGCDSERCVMQKTNTEKTRMDIIRRFKVVGPTDVTLLSNFNIDDVLKQWAMYFPHFHACRFSMVDWERVGDDFAQTDLGRDVHGGGRSTFGCVINTDTYNGRGKHWMAIFVDLRSRPATIEFFNSGGNPPQKGFQDWLERAKRQLSEVNIESEIVRVCKIRHQESMTECGVYSLWYIYARINGVPYEYFCQRLVPDKWMFEMRQHLFHDDKNLSEIGKPFDMKKFAQNVRILWE